MLAIRKLGEAAVDQIGRFLREGSMKADFRVEMDSLGEMQVPAAAYYGAQTARAVENFPISDLRFSRRFIRALGLIKKHAAMTNVSLDLIPEQISDAIQTVAQEVV